jgi:hypothetical protein
MKNRPLRGTTSLLLLMLIFYSSQKRVLYLMQSEEEAHFLQFLALLAILVWGGFRSFRVFLFLACLLPCKRSRFSRALLLAGPTSPTHLFCTLPRPASGCPHCEQKARSLSQDTVSEWLRRWTRNPLGSARRGSNPLGVAFL